MVSAWNQKVFFFGCWRRVQVIWIAWLTDLTPWICGINLWNSLLCLPVNIQYVVLYELGYMFSLNVWGPWLNAKRFPLFGWWTRSMPERREHPWSIWPYLSNDLQLHHISVNTFPLSWTVVHVLLCEMKNLTIQICYNKITSLTAGTD